MLFRSIADFWRRWHISLSSCLRDYLYIPFGGNRKGPMRTYSNLMLTMTIGGLWHGANWTFVLWGVYHGMLLSGERMTKPAIDNVPKVARQAMTFFLVVIGWTIFRADNLQMAAQWLSAMFSPARGLGGNLPGQLGLLLLLPIAGVLAHVCRNTFELKHGWSAPAGLGLTFLFVAALATITAGQQSPFLYFQF